MGRREMLHALAWGAAAGLAGCARRERRPDLEALAENDTTGAARARVHGRFAALVHVERTRALLTSSDAAALFAWAPLLARTGVDPLRDVHRAYVTAKSLDSGASAMVLQLEFDDDPEGRMGRLLAALAERDSSEEPPLDGGRVRTKCSGDAYVVASPAPGVLVALPAPEEGPVPSFAGLGELPEPRGLEAMDLIAKDPSETLSTLLDWPLTILEARAQVTLGREGARLELVARSTSSDQARRDAEALTERVNERAGVDLLLFRVPLLGELRFVPRGADVELVTTIDPTHLSLLLTLAEW